VSVSEQDIVRISSEIWASVLDMDIRHAGRDGGMPAGVRTMIGCIQITGDWEGAVTLYCPESLARRATSAMFGMPAADISDDEIQDTLGELTNMTAGNIKALLPGSCLISLPSVAEGVDYRLTVPGGRIAVRTSFECDGEPLQVTVLKRSR